MITILSIAMIVLGFLLVVATVKERHDKKCGDGYNKTDFFVNLVKGFYFLIIGSLVILKNKIRKKIYYFNDFILYF